jgi:hypothetical protein
MSNQQNFIGGLIVGKVIETVVGKALDKVAKSPSLSLQPKDVPATQEIVAKAVKEELAKREEHATNAEPAYQSRVAQGSLASILGAAALIAEFWTDGVTNTPMDYAAPVTVLVGAVWALYGRFIAKKPAAFFGRSGG